jgi:hypothetical protein
MNALRITLTLLALSSVLACNDLPIDSLGETFHIKVTNTEKEPATVKVDFLWVIDNSASMCQEQASLAESFDEFMAQITYFVNIDYRLAVVTTDGLSTEHAGSFRHHKTTEYPFACAQSEIDYCLQGEQGEQVCSAYGNNWQCVTQEKVNYITNCNGSVNSKCRKLCTQDAECDEQFLGAEAGQACLADPSSCTYKCLIPSGNPNNSGCVLRPNTASCPDSEELYRTIVEQSGRDPNAGFCPDGVTACNPAEGCNLVVDGNTQQYPCSAPAAYLTAATGADYFNCVGVVGAEQHNNANLEQGLNAAIYALDRGGVNASQANQFLRDDAYLVLVFVSDEDDCSVDDGLELKKEAYGTCTCLPDSLHGGKLRPVVEAVNRIKALKSDAGQVLVAAIVGDSTADTPEAITEERDLYFASKCSQCPNQSDQHPLLFNTYVCDSGAGKADYGRRYVEFVEAFGKNGILTNICSEDGVAPALDTIADRIIRVFTKTCLPRQLESNPQQANSTLEEKINYSGLTVQKIGPQGFCDSGAECCVKNSSECTGSLTCDDGSACSPVSVEVPYGGDPDTVSYQLQISADCDQTDDRLAIYYNFLIAPGTSISVDYQANAQEE